MHLCGVLRGSLHLHLHLHLCTTCSFVQPDWRHSSSFYSCTGSSRLSSLRIRTALLWHWAQEMARRGSVLGVVDLSQGVGWWVNSDPKPPASPGGASAASTHIQGDDVERRQLNHGRTIATTSLDHVVWPGLSGLSPATTQSVMIASRAAALSTAAKRYQPIINQWIPRKMDGERLRGLAKPKPRKSSKDALLELEQASVQVRSLDVVRLVALPRDLQLLRPRDLQLLAWTGQCCLLLPQPEQSRDQYFSHGLPDSAWCYFSEG
ncbi:unnamed protein product [Polarella glacialis]|uniref:Uncharacterized protein n=1 Tax=Polarella glacialis TaxID=89957 RepID=A0A813IQA6_POLGL|nr:unnamed protein product [Polarella glacialis]